MSTAERPGSPETHAGGAAAARGLAVGSAVVALGLAVGQVLSYLVNVVGARALGPHEYGELGAVLGLLLIGSVLPLAVQTVVARRVATAQGERRLDLALGARLGLVEAAGALLLTPLLAWGFRLDAVAVAMIALSFLPLTTTAVALGLEQGRQRFPALAVTYAVVAATRSGLALLVLATGGGVRAVGVATVAGSLLGWLAAAALARLPLASRHRPAGDAVRETVRVGHALLAMFVLTSLDVLLARVRLTDEGSGQYAAGGILVKIAFWLPQAVAVAAFARMSTGDRRQVGRAAVLVGGLGALAALTAWLLGPTVVPWVLGPDYTVAAGSPAVFVLAGSLQALAYLLLMGRLARQDHSAVWAVWGGTAVLVGLAWLLADTPLSLAWCVVSSATVVCLGGLLPVRRRGAAQPPSADVSGHGPGV